MNKIIITALSLLFGCTASLNAAAVPIVANNTSDFTIEYDSIGGDPAAAIDGLSAEIRFYNFTFAFGGVDTTVSFKFDITNTSESPVATSRVSTMGFQTTPDIITTGMGMGTPSGSLSGIFNMIDNGNVPNQGFMEFCFSTTNCAGGGGGGVDFGSSSLGNMAMLDYSGDISSVTFDKFTVRYQSVSCIDGFSGNCPGSASGNGMEGDTGGDDGGDSGGDDGGDNGGDDGGDDGGTIPTPGTLALFVLGLAGLGFTRRKQA